MARLKNKLESGDVENQKLTRNLLLVGLGIFVVGALLALHPSNPDAIAQFMVINSKLAMAEETGLRVVGVLVAVIGATVAAGSLAAAESKYEPTQ